MANTTKTEQQTNAEDGGILQGAAKAIGSALGTIAAKTGIATPSTPAKKSGRLPKTEKRRLPRKEKKLAKKKAMSSQA